MEMITQFFSSQVMQESLSNSVPGGDEWGLGDLQRWQVSPRHTGQLEKCQSEGLRERSIDPGTTSGAEKRRGNVPEHLPRDEGFLAGRADFPTSPDPRTVQEFEGEPVSERQAPLTDAEEL